MDASNLIKPVLAVGQLRCIGSTTYHEYRGIFEKDHALARRFQKIDVVEPTSRDGRDPQGPEEPLRGAPRRQVRRRGDQAAAELSAKHINDRHLPDKAIDVIDEAGAASACCRSRGEGPSASRIEDIVAKMARIPPKSVSPPTRTC
jgi:ATP-dependent Clp protease ATP-binding subunit ClpA